MPINSIGNANYISSQLEGRTEDNTSESGAEFKSVDG